jgi:aspartokinase-like uncharacterized kinase
VSRPVVVKLGGSLLDWPELPAKLDQYLQTRRSERPVIVIGGGRVTDAIRALDRIHGLGEERSHALALRSLDLTAHLLAALVPTLVVVERIESLDFVWAQEQFPILAPRIFLDDVDARSVDPLPHDWKVTSDSIAARVAQGLGGSELVLVKSAPLPPGTDRQGAARLGLVDPAFPESARRLNRVAYLNLREPGAVPVLLSP